MPINRQRTVILANLVAFWQVRIEIILARELIDRRDFAIERQANHDAILHRLPVDDWQRARHAQRQGVDRRIGVGFDAVDNRTVAEHLALGFHFGMDFQADHRLPIAHGSIPAGRSRFWTNLTQKP